MIWAKIDVNFAENPKILALNDRGFRVHLKAILYAKKHNTGGEILPHAAAHVGAKKAIIETLVAAALWDTTSRGGWQIHDWDDWNLSAERVEEISKERKLAGEKGGRKSAEARRKQTPEANAKQSASGNREAEKEIEKEIVPNGTTVAPKGARRSEPFVALTDAERELVLSENADFEGAEECLNLALSHKKRFDYPSNQLGYARNWFRNERKWHPEMVKNGNHRQIFKEEGIFAGLD